MLRLNFLNNQTNKPVVLITGANRGIGYEVCRLLAQNGSVKVILSCRNKEDGEVKTKILAQQYGDIQFLYLDVSNYDSIVNAVSILQKIVRSVDVLVNNAGIYIDSDDLNEFPSFFDVSSEILELTMDTNLFGPMYLYQLLLPFFSKNFLVINVSSGMGKLNTSDDRSGHIAYRSSKISLNAFSRSVSKENNHKQGKIISLCPGWVQSAMGGPNAPKTLSEGASEIITLINKQFTIKNGSFLYNFVEQNL